MTCVAWDGNTIAADGRIYAPSNQIIVTDTFKKILKLKNGGIIGFSGVWYAAEGFRRWLDGEAEAPEIGDTSFHIVYIDSKYRVWEYDNTTKIAIETSKIGAIGSGTPNALTTLDLGLDAVTAVKMAIKRDPMCGGKIRSIRYRD
jgi:hypothetical protein